MHRLIYYPKALLFIHCDFWLLSHDQIQPGALHWLRLQTFSSRKVEKVTKHQFLEESGNSKLYKLLFDGLQELDKN